MLKLDTIPKVCHFLEKSMWLTLWVWALGSYYLGSFSTLTDWGRCRGELLCKLAPVTGPEFPHPFPPVDWLWLGPLYKRPYLPCPVSQGAGIAQWLEHRTRDWKVAGSNPCWNGGRIFFSRVDFLCWLLFRYPFHPRVTTVARKKSRSFCQKRCRWQVTAKHAYTLRMWILLNRASALVTTCP